jgi:hypothetical protein
MSDYPAETETFPKKGSSGSGGIKAYSVEARYAYPEPRQVAGNLLDTRWRTIQFVEVSPPFGVPTGRSYHAPWLSLTGLYQYQAAQALRWWFLAAAEAERSCLCVETRLVEHLIDYSYTSTAQRPVAPVGEGESRSNIMPVDPPPLPVAVGGSRDV